MRRINNMCEVFKLHDVSRKRNGALSECSQGPGCREAEEAGDVAERRETTSEMC